MTLRSKEVASGFPRRYSAALRLQLARAAGPRSRSAGGLGREAVAAGLDRLDLVRIHQRTLIELLASVPPSGNGDGMLKRAADFLVDALTPVEIVYLGARKSVVGSNHSRPAARGRNFALAAPRRQLQREITRREAAQEALKKSEQHYRMLLERSGRMQVHLRRLSHDILSAHEEERKRISRELHDEIGQMLTAINVKLATLKKETVISTTALRKQVASTQRLLEKSMNTVHQFARELRPPQLDDLGLIPALHSHMKEFTKRTRIPVRFHAFAAVERLDSDMRLVLYRVAQESFTNVARHAHASAVNVTIRKLGGVVRMDIHDNGKSFDVDAKLHSKRTGRLGILGMRERVEMVGGTFHIESAPGKGTTVRAQIPFGAGRKKSRAARTRGDR